MKNRTASSGISIIPFQTEADSVEIATTRPETLLGDSAIAVNPDDERYKEHSRQDG